MTDHDPATRTEGEAETFDMPEGLGAFSKGQVLGERYQILEMLGRGGMGEVWHAFDLKLRVEVALKALRGDIFKSDRRLELLRQEVRAAREVVSPNVCRIFDLIEIDDRELVSMEYVDGATLLGVLQERGPLDLKEAQDIASQFLAGLEAIHKVGLIHRDIKPENIMLTRAGRVVVMDFGLARQEVEGGGSVSGTPAYMAPEQAAGRTLDARADVYSAGVVLAEMVSPEGIKSFVSRQSVWEGVRSEPAKLPDSPWAPVLKRAVAKDREGRYNTARTLTRALEDVTLRVEGAEDLHPYPGLASFTEGDAEYFFGREAEVEQMWRKLEGPARMLALVGPSGAGKTSFLRAGVIPSAAAQWAIVRCTPGTTALASLRQALVPVLGGDTEALGELAGGGDEATISACSRWRALHGKALLIVDQFEELFTLNSLDAQRRYSELLNQLPLASDVHVMVSMRDDFLMECNRFEILRPVVSDLTLVDRPTGANLRRALVQPSTKCGYRFEDDELVEEMLAEVEGERGALPLLAFAAARLWDKRDRETGLLTREAYLDIGGVGGALARHAEATLEIIGVERLPIVRELFRNLVTADGTRAIREWDELLSVFSDSQRGSPEEVLRELIDARLLTSYEVREEDHEPTRKVEIIHESLLANWPRLVRWQTQDADAAQLRDQLRQAARTWDEQGRSDDTLWTGSAYREFAVWREGYPGGLTEIEEALAAAMTSLATRRRRRRRIAAVAAIALALVVATIFATLWRRSVLETRRAEASKLLALAQVQLDTGPTEAMAYATASLELADTHEARIFALRALWAGPPLQALDLRQVAEGQFGIPTFSPDGRWLALAGMVNDQVLVYGEGRGQPIVLGGHAVVAGSIPCAWTRDGLLVTGHEEGARLWSMPEGQLIRTIDFGDPAWWQVGEKHLLAEVTPQVREGEPRVLHLKRWLLPDGDAEDLGSITWPRGASSSSFDSNGQAWIYAKGDSIYSRSLPITAGAPDTLIGRHSSTGARVKGWRRPQGLFSSTGDGEIILWTTADGTSVPGRRLPRAKNATQHTRPDPGGRWAIEDSLSMTIVRRLWDLASLPEANPTELKRSAETLLLSDFHPHGNWVATTTVGGEVVFWPLSAQLPRVVENWSAFEFTRDGRFLLASEQPQGQRDTRARLLPVPGGERNDIVEFSFPPQAGGIVHHITVGPDSRHVLATAYGRYIFLLSADGEEPRNQFGFPDSDLVAMGDFSPSGRLAAAASCVSDTQPTLRVWDLLTDEVRVFDLPEDPEAWEGYSVWSLTFVDETTVYTSGSNGLLRWDLETGYSKQILRAPPDGIIGMSASFDRRTVLTFDVGQTFERYRGSEKIHDLTTGEFRSLEIPGVSWPVLSPDGTIWATGEGNGLIWIGRVDGGDPNVVFGSAGWDPFLRPAISPDLKWITLSGTDKTMRLWPMPDLSKPPLHTLPHEELIAKLHSLTNLHVVRDEESSTGWKVEVGPFPGWAEVPEW